MESHRAKAAPKFSDVWLEVLLGAVRTRREVIYLTDGRKKPASATKKAWLLVAEEVSSRSTVPRSWLQCRKHFNGLTRSGKEKRVQNARERTRTGGGPPQIVQQTDEEEKAMERRHNGPNGLLPCCNLSMIL